MGGETGLNYKPRKDRPELRPNATWDRTTTAAVSYYHQVVVFEKAPTAEYSRSIVAEKRGSVWEPPTRFVVPRRSSG